MTMGVGQHEPTKSSVFIMVTWHVPGGARAVGGAHSFSMVSQPVGFVALRLRQIWALLLVRFRFRPVRRSTYLREVSFMVKK